MQYLLSNIEALLTDVFMAMEQTGIRISIDELLKFDKYIRNLIEQTEQSIYDDIGHEFDILSPQQLGKVLFEELDLPSKRKYQNQKYTNIHEIEELRDRYEIVDNILKYRQYTKLYQTYVKGIYDKISSDGKLHMHFYTNSQTGRVSTNYPKIQNIPVHLEVGSQLKKFFIAGEGKVFIDASYDQIEMCVMAHFCRDKNMIEILSSGNDFHTSTAAFLFDTPIQKVSPEMRRIAKSVNFCIIYNTGAYSLSKDIGTSVIQANKYIQKYGEIFPEVNNYIEKAVNRAKDTGVAITMFGRKRPIPKPDSSNKFLQTMSKRIAISYPIMGTVADIINIAMIKVYSRLKAEKISAQLILQVHNELIVESDISYASRCQDLLREEMLSVCKMTLPLVVKIKHGTSWYEAQKE